MSPAECFMLMLLLIFNKKKSINKKINIMKKITAIVLLILMIPAIQSCTKEYEKKNISYLITGLANPFTVAYIDENGKSVSLQYSPTHDGDVWRYNFTGQQGDILYLFCQFTDVDLDPTKFKFRILIEGKVYKEAFGYDQAEEDGQGNPFFRVKRSGHIPY